MSETQSVPQADETFALRGDPLQPHDNFPVPGATDNPDDIAVTRLEPRQIIARMRYDYQVGKISDQDLFRTIYHQASLIVEDMQDPVINRELDRLAAQADEDATVATEESALYDTRFDLLLISTMLRLGELGAANWFATNRDAAHRVAVSSHAISDVIEPEPVTVPEICDIEYSIPWMPGSIPSRWTLPWPSNEADARQMLPILQQCLLRWLNLDVTNLPLWGEIQEETRQNPDPLQVRVMVMDEHREIDISLMGWGYSGDVCLLVRSIDIDSRSIDQFVSAICSGYHVSRECVSVNLELGEQGRGKIEWEATIA